VRGFLNRAMLARFETLLLPSTRFEIFPLAPRRGERAGVRGFLDSVMLACFETLLLPSTAL
jgi:hypothetical protein